jgi:hypothetical protein
VPKGISLHVGLNHVDAAAYGGWDSALAGCVNDAHDMAAIATAEGYRVTILVERRATAAAVLNEIRATAAKLTAGDEFLLTFAGHGAQIDDADTEDVEPTGFDETWVCWDRQLLDDEVYAALAGFAADVRILVISDSTHCGTAVRHPLAPSPPVRTPDGARRARVMTTAAANADATRRRASYARARHNARAELHRTMSRRGTFTRRQAQLRKPTGCLAARAVLLNACQDNQVAYDGPDNGAFTAALLNVWNGGRFDGTHRDLLAAIRARLLAQTPNYLAIGPGDAAWEDSRPFTIDITADLQADLAPGDEP